MQFQQLIQQVKKTTLEALAHKNMPFETLVQQLKPERVGSSNPLFQVMFLYNPEAAVLDMGQDIVVEDEMLDLGVSKFDLTLYVNEQKDHLNLGMEYAQDLFKASTVQRMLDHMEVLLQAYRPWQQILKLLYSRYHCWEQ